MRILMASQAPHTASAALSAAHASLTAVLGALLLVLWGFTHHFLAHRNHFWEGFAKILLICGGVVIGVTFLVVTQVVNRINDATATMLDNWSGGTSFTSLHVGLVSFIALFDVGFALVVVWDLIKHKRRPGNSGNGGRGWDRAEAMFNRFGWFALGPLAVTLPGVFGAAVLTLLTRFTGYLGHLVGAPLGFA